MSSISAALAARAQPPAPAAVPISSGRLAELGSGNPSADSSAGASNPSPATPALWEAPAVGGAAGAAAAEPAAAAEDAEDPKGMRAAHCAALLAAVAAVQVQMVLAQLSKKTVTWFAAGARYGPEGEGVVVWVTRGAVTSRRQVEHRAPIEQTPPNVAKVVVDLAISDRSVALCGELGVPDQLRKLVLKGKGKGGGDSDSSDSAPEIVVGKGKGKEEGKGKGRGKGKGKEEVVVSDSESSDSDVPISSTGVRRGQVAPKSSDSDSKVPVSSTGVKRGRAAPDSGALQVRGGRRSAAAHM